MAKLIILAFLALVSFTYEVSAQKTLVGLGSDGLIYQISLADGSVTALGGEAISVGGFHPTARKRDLFYYVSAPSGTGQKHIYTFNISTAVWSHVALDLIVQYEEEVSVLFIQGEKLYGVIQTDAGAARVYEIDPTTGLKTLIINFDDIDRFPIWGAFTKLGKYYYVIGYDIVDNTLKSLIRLDLTTGTAVAKPIVDGDNNPVSCSRLKTHKATRDFVCISSVFLSPSVCRLRRSGRASCINTLTDVNHVGNGHTLITPNDTTYYAIVHYNDSNTEQHLIKFNSRGQIKKSVPVDPIILSAEFN